MRRVSWIAVLPAILLTFLLLVRFRPRSVARFNRAVTNRLTLRFAGRAPGFGIVIHRGRTTGRVYRTPVNIFPGPGGCLLETQGRTYRLSDPAIVHDPSHRRLPPFLRLIPRIGGVTDYLRLSMPERPAAAAGASS